MYLLSIVVLECTSFLNKLTRNSVPGDASSSLGFTTSVDRLEGSHRVATALTYVSVLCGVHTTQSAEDTQSADDVVRG